jgi:hypothetical protein
MIAGTGANVAHRSESVIMVMIPRGAALASSSNGAFRRDALRASRSAVMGSTGGKSLDLSMAVVVL